MLKSPLVLSFYVKYQETIATMRTYWEAAIKKADTQKNRKTENQM